jgi:hypothetical protein
MWHQFHWTHDKNLIPLSFLSLCEIYISSQMAMKYYTIKSSLLNYCKQTKSCEQFKYPIFTYK